MTGLDFDAVRARLATVDRARVSPDAWRLYFAAIDSSKDVPELLAEVERLAAELAAMTELHDQKHRDWQMADNARQRLLVDRGNLRADLQLYEPARHGNAVYWIHACGFVEAWPGHWTPTGGECDACESGSGWQPLYTRRGGEPS